MELFHQRPHGRIGLENFLPRAGHVRIVRRMAQQGTQSREKLRAIDFPAFVARRQILQCHAVGKICPEGGQRGDGAAVVETH